MFGLAHRCRSRRRLSPYDDYLPVHPLRNLETRDSIFSDSVPFHLTYMCDFYFRPFIATCIYHEAETAGPAHTIIPQTIINKNFIKPNERKSNLLKPEWNIQTHTEISIAII